jgi:hypothetical protein
MLPFGPEPFVFSPAVKNVNVRIYNIHKLRVFENRVLRRIFGPKRDGVTGGWRKILHNEELHNLYSSLSKIRIIKSRRMRWTGHVARMGKKREEMWLHG